MDDKRKIAVATADRSERGILEPVIRRLEVLHAEKKILFELVQRGIVDTTHGEWMLTDDPKADVILIPADRKEMIDLAQFCYYDCGVPIFHLWAGVGETGTWDDLNRRVISSYAYLMLCEDELSRMRLIKSGEEPWRCKVVGSTHFDDLEFDDSIVPRGTYDLILVNPNPGDLEDQRQTVQNVYRLLEEDSKPAIFISGGAENLRHGATYDRFTYYESLPRPQFLGLLKNCRRFISNSSATVYEAPYFGVKVVNPGKRNLERKTDFDKKPGAADRIVELLTSFPIDKSKLLKRYP